MVMDNREIKHDPPFVVRHYRDEMQGYDEKQPAGFGGRANDRQVAGNHYRADGDELQHWDLVIMFNWCYFVGQITKYLMRYKRKNGVQDLKKAQHFLEKLIEKEEREQGEVPVAREGTR